MPVNCLNPELNSICHLLALLGAHHILHVSRIKVKDNLHRYNKATLFIPYIKIIYVFMQESMDQV